MGNGVEHVHDYLEAGKTLADNKGASTLQVHLCFGYDQAVSSAQHASRQSLETNVPKLKDRNIQTLAWLRGNDCKRMSRGWLKHMATLMPMHGRCSVNAVHMMVFHEEL